MYNHSKHAGNHGDMLKHLMLRTAIKHLVKVQASPIRFTDTHAAEGIYETDTGVYKGSTAIAADMLRLNNLHGGSPDVIYSCEINPTKAAKLKENVPVATVDVCNGFYGHNQRLRDHHHDLVLIDPPCDNINDYFEILGLAAKVTKQKNSTLLIWLPQKSSDKLSNEVIAQLTNLCDDKWVNTFTTNRYQVNEQDMHGSTIVCISADAVLLEKLNIERVKLQSKFNNIQ